MVIVLKRNRFSKIAHPDLLLAQELVYKPSGLVLQNLKTEDESTDYGASEFTIENRSVKFRVGKITPTKVGQFVTFLLDRKTQFLKKQDLLKLQELLFFIISIAIGSIISGF